jgi:hypothetical protein
MPASEAMPFRGRWPGDSLHHERLSNEPKAEFGLAVTENARREIEGR